jgi:hypothetical protein
MSSSIQADYFQAAWYLAHRAMSVLGWKFAIDWPSTFRAFQLSYLPRKGNEI